jgi:large subunit ribosomal protein L21
MYAVIETGGKQYRVEVGTELEIELIEAGPGESVAFDRVLLVADGETASIGRPVVANAAVSAEVVRRERGEKLISFKYRPKARRRVKKGHRQELTRIRISDIVLDGKSAAGERAEAEEKRKTERQRLEEAARRQAAKDAELAAKLAADAKSAEKAADRQAKGAAKRGTADAKAPVSDAAKARAARTDKATTAKADATDTTDTGAKAAAPKKTTSTRATGAAKRTRTTKTDKE